MASATWFTWSTWATWSTWFSGAHILVHMVRLPEAQCTSATLQVDLEWTKLESLPTQRTSGPVCVGVGVGVGVCGCGCGWRVGGWRVGGW